MEKWRKKTHHLPPWSDEYAGIVTEKSPVSKKLFFTTSLFGKNETRIRRFSFLGSDLGEKNLFLDQNEPKLLWLRNGG